MLVYMFVVSALDRASSLAGSDERGASLVEYTFLLTFVVVVTIGSIKFFGGSVNDSLTNSGNAVNNVVQNGH